MVMEHQCIVNTERKSGDSHLLVILLLTVRSMQGHCIHSGISNKFHCVRYIVLRAHRASQQSEETELHQHLMEESQYQHLNLALIT